MSRLSFTCSTAVVAVVAGAALGDELWRQGHANCTANPSHCYGGPASQEARNAGGPGWMYEVADNFDAPAGWTINSLEFWGGQATLTPAVTEGFMIRFYADNGGQPGALLRTQDVFTFAQTVYFTWIPAFPLQGFHYTLTLGEPFEVPAAGRYWMSIVAIQPYGGPNDRQWFWNISETVRGPFCVQDSDPPGTYSPQTYDVAFVLYGSAGPSPCYANCDGSTGAPILNVNDFICFQSKYAAQDPSANCDESTAPPTLNVNDFICFQMKYAAGCP